MQGPLMFKLGCCVHVAPDHHGLVAAAASQINCWHDQARRHQLSCSMMQQQLPPSWQDVHHTLILLLTSADLVAQIKGVSRSLTSAGLSWRYGCSWGVPAGWLHLAISKQRNHWFLHWVRYSMTLTAPWWTMSFQPALS